MTRKAKENKLAEMKALVADMEGVDRAMADDLLWAYVEVWEDVQELTARLDKEGLLIEVEKGGTGNRHMELVKNPAYDMRHKSVAQLADLANKIRRFVSLSGVKEQDDEFTAFMLS